MSDTPSSASTDSSADQAAIQQLAERYGELAAALDLEGFTSLYADDVLIHDLFSAEALEGIDAWRAQVRHWFGDVKPEDSNVARVEPLTIHVSGDLATAYGRVRYAVVEPDGSERYGMWNRLTWALRRGDDGAWRILHEHTSVSIDAESGTPALG